MWSSDSLGIKMFKEIVNKLIWYWMIFLVIKNQFGYGGYEVYAVVYYG